MIRFLFRVDKPIQGEAAADRVLVVLDDYTPKMGYKIHKKESNICQKLKDPLCGET